MRHATFKLNPNVQLWPKFGDRVINGAACELGAICGQDKLRFLDATRLLRDALGISTTLLLRDPLQN
jgi:hypothetical protein